MTYFVVLFYQIPHKQRFDHMEMIKWNRNVFIADHFLQKLWYLYNLRALGNVHNIIEKTSNYIFKPIT